MRKMMILLLAGIVAGIVVGRMITPDERTTEEVFADAMPFAHWDTYVDPSCGYSFIYPSFFTLESDDHHGHVRLGYHANQLDLVLESRVDDRATDDFDFTQVADTTTDIIRTGQLPGLDGYHFYAHHVRHHGRWYTLTLLYPYSCRKGAADIIHEVKTWRPFEKRVIG